MTDTAPRLHGHVAPGWGAVADAITANFAERGEVGCAVAVHHHGEPVVDLWGGVADRDTGRPWAEDTLALVFSTTKGMAAVCVARLVAEGRLSPDDRVADHWPEFAANGKDRVTVGQLMSHRAGLSHIEPSPTLADVLAVDPVVEALAAMAPLWEPDTAHGYHAVTYGWLAGELVRRIDGRRIGRYLAEEVAGPLGLDTWIGLPESEEPRVSTLLPSPPPSTPEEWDLALKIAGPGTAGARALTLDGALALVGADLPFNTREVHATEMPAANGITDARSVSKMYAATIGEVDGVRLLDDDSVELLRTERSLGDDRSLVLPTRFGFGMMLDHPTHPLLGEGSFGHWGAGGSVGAVSPEDGLSVAYVMNQMGGGIAGDPRAVAVLDAARSCV